MEENKQNTNEGVKNSFYGTKLSFMAAKLFLAGTTAIAAYAAGQSVIKAMTGNENTVGAIVFAIMVMVFVDGSLDNDMNYVLEKYKAPKYKWGKIILLSIATGGSTWFSASIIADMGTNYINNNEKSEILREAIAENEKDLDRLSDDIDRKNKEIDLLKSQYAADTSMVLQAMNKYHAKYWKSGKWKAYYGDLPKYKSLTASIDKVLAIDTVYQKNLSALTADLDNLNAAYVTAGSKDVTSTVDESVKLENSREESKNNNISIFIKCLDFVGIFILWLLFFDLRQMKKDENLDLSMTSVNLIRWSMDKLSKMQKKALETPTKLDDKAVQSLIVLVKILASFLGLFNSIAEGVIKAVNKVSEILSGSTENTTNEDSKNTTEKSSEFSTSNSIVQLTERMPISTNEKRTVVKPFQRHDKTSEDNGSTSNIQPIQQPLATMVEQLNLVEQPPINTTIENHTKVVEMSPKIKASTPDKKPVNTTVREVVEITRDKTGEVLAEIDRGDKVEQVNISTVQRRKGSWKSKRSSAKTKRGKNNAKEWYQFYADLEKKMKESK